MRIIEPRHRLRPHYFRTAGLTSHIAPELGSALYLPYTTEQERPREP